MTNKTERRHTKNSKFCISCGGIENNIFQVEMSYRNQSKIEYLEKLWENKTKFVCFNAISSKTHASRKGNSENTRIRMDALDKNYVCVGYVAQRMLKIALNESQKC